MRTAVAMQPANSKRKNFSWRFRIRSISGIHKSSNTAVFCELLIIVPFQLLSPAPALTNWARQELVWLNFASLYLKLS